MDGVAFTTLDGRPVAVTAGTDRTVRLWDFTTGQQLHVFTGHTDFVWSVDLAMLNGRPVAVTGSSDGTVRVWDLRFGLEAAESPSTTAGRCGR
ncbi:hypothetical protein ACFQYP_56920 [Nonomuraea antimicrobica]